MKFWLRIIVVILLGSMICKANATTVDLPLDGEIKVTGDITTSTWITFFVVANSMPDDPRPAGNPISSEGSWLFNIVLAQANEAGAFSAPQVCSLTDGCFLLSNFLGCGGSFGCSESNPEGYGYLRNGIAAPIRVSDDTNIFSIATSASADVPFDLELEVDLPGGLGIEVLRAPLLNAAAFGSAAAATPNPAALPLFAAGLFVMALVGWRVRDRKLASVPIATG